MSLSYVDADKIDDVFVKTTNYYNDIEYWFELSRDCVTIEKVKMILAYYCILEKIEMFMLCLRM